MHFDLKRPCKSCPFRTDIPPFLHERRAREIIDAITSRQQTFACHMTTSHDDDDEHVPTPGEQHCAGALILLEKIGRPNQMMRIAERIKMYDASKLDMKAPVFDTPRQWIAAQRIKRNG